MVEVKESQTAAFLKSKILDTLAEYNVPIENIFSVTVDNGANMVAAVNKLRQELEQTLIEKIEEEDIKDDETGTPGRDITAELCVEFHERINLVRCSVHTLQLAILDTVNRSHDEVKSLTELARKTKNVRYQTNFDHHNASHPPIWNQTRWCGIFEMVQSFKIQRPFFEQLAAQFPELDLTDHWNFIDNYYEAFKPLYICTKKMQAEHVSLPDFYMFWLMAISEVRKMQNNPFVPGLLNSLTTRLANLRGSRAFKISLFLDPRFNYRGSKKKVEIQGYINETWQRIRQLQTPASGSNIGNESLTGSENNDDFDEYLTEMFGGSVNMDGEPSETKFLQQLQSLDLEPRQNYNYNVWDHWLRRKTTHPELYAVAMVVLSTPSNQVSVERAFSVLGLVLSNLRTQLAEDTLTNILLVKLNKALFPQAIATAYNWKEVERNQAAL
ncbi:uncharacterized protein LOC115269892 [Aedes albopictus]|uniref:HAT C-terminal dimerisation domain-containing protein n=1 Tax=Aedes albopictus TaxID=7160 RepID=A0ABM1ZQZ4_AEDAL|nr:uncharacterized protein LOC115269892 [Aedes albopictus]